MVFKERGFHHRFKGKKVGSSLITEDVVVPISKLSSAIDDIEKLLVENNYEKVVFGHALFGNIHIIFSINFSEKKKN